MIPFEGGCCIHSSQIHSLMNRRFSNVCLIVILVGLNQASQTTAATPQKVETVSFSDVQAGAATFNGRLQQAEMNREGNDTPGKEPLFQQYGTRTLTTFEKHPELVSALKKLNPKFDPHKMGTSDLSSVAIFNGRALLILSGCVPHDCGGTVQIVAFEPSTKLVYLLQPTTVDFPDTPPDTKFNLYGNPDSAVRAAMYRAYLHWGSESS